MARAAEDAFVLLERLTEVVTLPDGRVIGGLLAYGLIGVFLGPTLVAIAVVS